MKRNKGGAVAVFCAAALLTALLGPGAAGAQEQTDWRVEFEAVCATTDASLSLTAEELTDFVARCDKLAERIGAEEETVRKVYLRRLKMCRDLFAYVLESRGAGEPGQTSRPPEGSAPGGGPGNGRTPAP